MATETNDYEAVLSFLADVARRECTIADSAVPESRPGDAETLSLDLGLAQEYDHFRTTGEWRKSYRVFVSGWHQLEGVMITTPEEEFDTDLRVGIAATGERALKDLLLAFPRGKVGFFLCAGEWTMPALAEVFDGSRLPPRDALIRTGDSSLCRVHCYRGIKRGSIRTSMKGSRTGEVEARSITSKKDPVIAEFRELSSLQTRLERSTIVVEESMLVRRAVEDGLPVEKIVYTGDLEKQPNGELLLNRAASESIPHYRVSGGLMGALTTTRPVPSVVASVHSEYRDAKLLHLHDRSTLLIVDGVSSPDNLGMVIRTADAAGIEAVVLTEEKASPFHKNCIRAARGAIGRVPLASCGDPGTYLRMLAERGFAIVGTTAHATKELYDLEFRRPVALVVGSESEGVSQFILELCTDRVRIPMAPGQSSLSVAVATGVLLYELVRSRV